MHTLRLFICCVVLFVMSGALWSAADEADSVVILANSNDPGSLETANYYAQQREIPAANIIALPMPNKETISLREYVDTVHNPLLNRLIDQEWVRAVKARTPDKIGRERASVGIHTISYLVTTRGVPLRIANDPTLVDERLKRFPDAFMVNNGSVDSELALLIAPPNISITAFVPNPLFARPIGKGIDSERVIPVSRLDGPDVVAIKRMIDRSLQAESTGLVGRAYFDIGGPHAKGDEWIRAARELAKSAYFDTDFEDTKRLVDETDRYDTPAIYMGWYRRDAYGPWSQPRWPVPPGAIGFHLHSFSATTVRSTTSGWLGALISQGYCATVGNVYEPYLEYTHHPHLLLKALLEGRTFGEAVMLSNPVLSWQGVAIGDPLYRPFKVDLDTQLQEAGDNPLSAYIYLREINRLKSNEGLEEALAFAKTQFKQQPSLPLAYALAMLYVEKENIESALKVLELIRSMERFSIDEVMLVKAVADFFDQHDMPELALDFYRTLIDQTGLSKAQKTVLLKDGSEIALKQGRSKLYKQWTLAAQKLGQE